jgi:hypothetical protein
MEIRRRHIDGRISDADSWRFGPHRRYQGKLPRVDAKDGNVLLKKDLGDPIGGGIVTYEIGGAQYVAIAGGMKNTVTQQPTAALPGSRFSQWPSSR